MIALEFERGIADLETKIAELQAKAGGMNIDAEVQKLQQKITQQLASIYASLSPWQKTLVARHPQRPHFHNYIDALISDFVPLAGDRKFSEDKAIVGGIGRFRGRSVVILGHEKGHDTQTRITHNFGMAKPEGYRKAARLMELANQFSLPVISLVDTSGAFPGVQAEERGQAEAVARSTQACLALSVPMVAVIVGEGGSGGAIAIAAANRVLMLEHAIYSIISPEGCASILWRTAEKAADAANALKLTAQDLLQLKIIDKIIPEPLGGAHRSPEIAITSVGNAVEAELKDLQSGGITDFRADRRAKFLAMGALAA